MAGKVLIYGGSGGIGSATARALRARGYELHLVGRGEEKLAAVPALKKAPGTASVVLFSSVAARQGFTFHASMGMAKGAVQGLTLSLAAELAPKIRVNAIAPSLTRTTLAAGLVSNEAMATTISGLHALQRLGEPEDIASAAAYLISSDAAWITGQVIGIDGGRSSIRSKG